jgi:hypothetical protein
MLNRLFAVDGSPERFATTHFRLKNYDWDLLASLVLNHLNVASLPLAGQANKAEGSIRFWVDEQNLESDSFPYIQCVICPQTVEATQKRIFNQRRRRAPAERKHDVWASLVDPSA